MSVTRVKIVDRLSAADAIKQLDEADLRYLNALIVERLKLIHQAKTTALMSRFSAGDRVGFTARDGSYRQGLVTRLNQKTVSVLGDDRRQWKVSPALLELIRAADDVLWG